MSTTLNSTSPRNLRLSHHGGDKDTRSEMIDADDARVDGSAANVDPDTAMLDDDRNSPSLD